MSKKIQKSSLARSEKFRVVKGKQSDQVKIDKKIKAPGMIKD